MCIYKTYRFVSSHLSFGDEETQEDIHVDFLKSYHELPAIQSDFE